MLTQKQWKVQLLAEHMYTTATIAATATADRMVRQLPMAKEHAVVAEEIRNISVRVMETLEKNIFGSLPDSEFEAMVLKLSRQTAFLALNAALVSSKLREQKSLTLAVVADELRNTSMQMTELYGSTWKYKDLPAVSPRNSVVSSPFEMFYAVSGPHIWYENVLFVQEILNYCPEYIHNNRLVINNTWRDLDAPLIQFGEVPEDAGIVIISDAFDSNKQYAVVAEFNVTALFRSHVGVNKPCSADIPVRECWSASDGSDVIFPDWEKLSSIQKTKGPSFSS